MNNEKENYQREIKELLKELAKLIFVIFRFIFICGGLILALHKLIRG